MSRVVPLLQYTPSWRAHGRIYVSSFTKNMDIATQTVFTDDQIWPNSAISLEGNRRS